MLRWLLLSSPCEEKRHLNFPYHTCCGIPYQMDAWVEDGFPLAQGYRIYNPNAYQTWNKRESIHTIS